MGILVRAFNRPVDTTPTRPAARRSMEQMLGSSGGGVSEEGAMRLSAVYACVRVLAETVASLPLIVYERQERGKRRATESSLYALLHDAPNPLMTAFEWRETLMGHLALWGNAYCEIEYSNGGEILALWPLRPDQMEDIRRSSQGLTYVYRLPDGKQQLLAGEKVFHVRGLSPDGVRGYSPIADFSRRLVGMGLAVEAYGSAFFGNGARPGGVLQHPGKLSDEAYDNLRSSWGARHEGVSNAHRVAILEEGMTFQAVGVPPEEAQFLESMKFNRTQIASIFRVPPHMIGDLERATFSNIEQQSIEFKTYTLEPWLVRWQMAINARLMNEVERARLFVEFLADALLRGDTVSRYQAHSIGRQNGWLSANDIREMENMNPVDGGDVYLVPLNMIPAGGDATPDTKAEDAAPKPEPEPGKEEGRAVALRNGVEVRAEQWSAAAARHELQVAYLPIYEDVAARITKREANDIGNAARRLLAKGQVDEFEAWLERFYDDHLGYVERQYRPVVRSYAAQIAALTGRELGKEGSAPDATTFVDAYVAAAAARQVGRTRARVRKALRRGPDGERRADDMGEVAAPEIDEGLLGRIEDELLRLRENEPAHLAREESVRASNALALALYRAWQVLRKRWITIGDNCPYCDGLAGRTIGIDSFFLALGQSFLPEGAAVPLIVGNDVGHAPAHDGCDCMVVAG